MRILILLAALLVLLAQRNDFAVTSPNRSNASDVRRLVGEEVVNGRPAFFVKSLVIDQVLIYSEYKLPRAEAQPTGGR